MSEFQYKWGNDQQAPKIGQHSIAKHEILKAYLTKYLQTLTVFPSQDQFRLTIVDGFAGGGIYVHKTTGQKVQGSPLIILGAVKEAERLINANRPKKINFQIDYFFIDDKPQTVDVLKKQLISNGYGSQIGVNIHVINDEFGNRIDEIKTFIKNKSRSKRSIFLLDQFGYSDVPTHQIRSLLTSLPGAEVILTFAVDSFLNYANDGKTTQQLLNKIGVPNCLEGYSIKELKQSEKNWRFIIQSCLHKGLVDGCGARFFTPFFIRSKDGHGDYWLIHLSQHAKARDVMTGIHWQKNNRFIHYGGAGIDMFQMLGYDPEEDSCYTGQDKLAFCFDNDARQQSVQALSAQIPELIYSSYDGLAFGELFSTTCNTSPASAEIYRESLELLIAEKELEIFSQDGVKRRSANSIHNSDQILPPRQLKLF